MNKLSSLIIIALVTIGSIIYFSWTIRHADVATTHNISVTSSANHNTNSSSNLVSTIVYSGHQVPYSAVFGNPDTSSWEKYCLASNKCLKFNPVYKLCPSQVGNTSALYLMENPTCIGNQDAPAFVIQKLLSPDQTPTIESGYIFTLTQKVKPSEQVTTDEIIGSVNNHTLTCYNTHIDRECKLTYLNGEAYSLDGRSYNNASLPQPELQKIRASFDGLVRSMLEQ